MSGRVSPAESIASSKSRTPKRKAAPEMDDGGEETNINVVVRCRGRNDREVRENSGVVVSTDGVKGKKVELSMGPSALSNKTYNFDKVFSPAADQGMLFDEVVAPIMDEVCSAAVSKICLSANSLSGPFWIQLYHLCVWSDRHRKDVHHVWRHYRNAANPRRCRHHPSRSALAVRSPERGEHGEVRAQRKVLLY
jgi:hypothetical protein